MVSFPNGGEIIANHDFEGKLSREFSQADLSVPGVTFAEFPDEPKIFFRNSLTGYGKERRQGSTHIAWFVFSGRGDHNERRTAPCHANCGSNTPAPCIT